MLENILFECLSEVFIKKKIIITNENNYPVLIKLLKNNNLFKLIMLKEKSEKTLFVEDIRSDIYSIEEVTDK